MNLGDVMDSLLNVLLVEDDPAHAEAIRRAFQTGARPVEVRWAGTLQEFRDSISTRTPDIAILDLNLPDGNALEALSHPAVPFGFPVLIMTSYGDEKIAVEAMKAGALDYIVKSPESFATMPRFVEVAMREWQLLLERRQTEKRILHLNSVLRGIRNVNQLITKEMDQLPLLREACGNLVETMGYRAVWIALGLNPGEMGLTAWSGIAEDGTIRLAEQISKGHLPRYVEQALSRDGVYCEILSPVDCGKCAMLGAFPECGVLSAVMKHDSLHFGVMTAVVPKEFIHDPEEQDLFAELVGDLSFALHRQHQVQQHRLTENALAKSQSLYQNLEEQFRMAQRLEAIGRLAGGVAHDFNNLLSVILNYAGFAVENLAPEDPVRSDIEEITKAARRAAELTRQLLAFSHRQVLQPEVLNLNQITRGIENMLVRLLGENIRVRVHAAPDLGNCRADPGQLEQVIMNLAVNARDAMPKGGKLTIETANVDLDADYAENHVAVTPGPYVMLSVTDSGMGMGTETMEHIFEPFFTTKEKGKGTGLGLATVYGIVKQSGGSIWVYSEPGRGTTFKLYFPRVDAPSTVETRRRKDSAMVQGSGTVLLVEDEPAVRKIAERILQRAGYRVLSASSAEEAIELHLGNLDDIHLLLTDVVMTGMTGRELASRLSDRNPNLKVLFMSGYTDNAIVHNGFLDPGTQFIGKPFTAADLTRRVHELLATDQS